jgi:hypothetical protein
MSRHLKINISTPNPVKFNGRGVFRIMVEVVEAVGMEAEVFLHERLPISTDPLETADAFVAICNPFDFAYPINDPDPTQDNQYFRKSTVDFLIPSVDLARDIIDGNACEGIDGIKAQLQTLIDTMQDLDDMSEAQEDWINGTPPPTTTEEP